MRFVKKYGIWFALIIGLIRFVSLGSGDVNEWDESLYAIRTNSIIQHGDWLDQTSHAAGGFYSSVHPPLYNWLSVISVKLFGETTFAYRFWSGVFASLLFVLVYRLAGNGISGLIAAIALSSSPSFNFYSIQGQLDILYIFFAVFSILFFLKHETLNSSEENIRINADESKIDRWLVLAGLSFGMALMSKAMIGFIVPITIGAYLIFKLAVKQITFQTFFRDMAILCGLGIAVALPWHIALILNQSFESISYLINFHLFKRMAVGVEHNTKALGPFYYPNQLMVQMSIYLPSILLIFTNKLYKKINIRLLLFLIIAPLLVFSASSTKIPSYLLIIFIPIVILAGIGIEAAFREKRINPIIMSLITMVFVWSQFQNLRDYIQDNIKSEFLIYGFAISSIFLCLYLIFKYIDKNRLRHIFGHAKLTLAYVPFAILFSMMAINFGVAMGKFATCNNFSRIGEASELFFKDDYKSLIYIDPSQKSEVTNPQITFYFKGIDIGWDSTKNYKYFDIPDKNYVDKNFNDKTMIVLCRKTCKNLYADFENSLKNKYEKLFDSEFYTVWIKAVTKE